MLAKMATAPTVAMARVWSHSQTTLRVQKSDTPMTPRTRVRYWTWMKAHRTLADGPKRVSRYSALVYMPARYMGRKMK